MMSKEDKRSKTLALTITKELFDKVEKLRLKKIEEIGIPLTMSTYAAILLAEVVKTKEV